MASTWERGPGWSLALGVVGWGLPFGAWTASRDVAREGAGPAQVAVSVLVGAVGGILFGALMHLASTDRSGRGTRRRTGAAGRRRDGRSSTVLVPVALMLAMYATCFLFHGLPLSRRPGWMPWWLLGQFVVNTALVLLLVRSRPRASDRPPLPEPPTDEAREHAAGR